MRSRRTAAYSNSSRLDASRIAPPGFRRAGTPFFFLLGANELPLRQGFALWAKRLSAPDGAPHLGWGPKELREATSP